MTEYARLVLSVDSTQARRSADDLGKLDVAGRKTEQAMAQLERQTHRNAQSAGQLGSAFSMLKGTLAAAISVSALQSVAGMVQGYQEMAERVRMASSSVAEYEAVQKRLLATANGTYRSMAEAQELYIRTADSLRSLGYTTEQALDVTDSMSYAFVTNAASADRAGAAISAFSKSMNTGKVAADQWETLTSAIPTVINAIADSSGRSAAEIRALGAAGKLTARDLSEGLRKSLDENSKAAESMAANMTDAGVRAKTAMTALFVAMEESSGVIQGVTDSIIGASKAVLGFTSDSEAVSGALKNIGTAAEIAGTVIAARLVTAMIAYTGSQGLAIASTIARTQAENAALGASARRAVAEKAAAMAALATARAEFQAAAGTNAHAMAASALVAAQGRAAQSAAAHAAAQSALKGTVTASTVAARGLGAAMAVLGGPLGIAVLAAAAIYQFASAGREARPATDDLTKSVRELSKAQRELAAIEAGKKLDELADKSKTLAENLAYAESEAGRPSERSRRFAEDAVRIRVEQEKLNQEVGKYTKRLQEIKDYKEPGPAAAADAPVGPAEPASSEGGQRSLMRMRDQLELAKLQGVARERLAAIQSLGINATKQEREEAERLATEIYRLEDAQKKATGSAKELSKAHSDDAATKMLMSLREQESVLKSQLSGTDKLTAQQREMASWAQQLADIKSKSILTAEQKSLLKNEAIISSQMASNVALGEEVRMRDEALKLQERTAQLQESVSGSRENRRDQYDLNLGAFGQGNAAQEQAAAAADIFKQFRKYQDELNESTPKDLLGSAQYLRARSQIGEGLREALAEHEDYYARIEELQGSSMLGASQALSDYADNARDVYSQTASMVSGVMDTLTEGIAESMTSAIMHGEDLRESMAALGDTLIESVLSSLIEMGVQYGINAALEMAGITAVSAAKVVAKTTETTANITGTTAEAAAEVTAAGAVTAAKIAGITATATAAGVATATTTATQTAAAATTAAAWTPAAIVSSIGSFGTAAAIGLAAVVAALAFTGGFRKGGYTGNGGVNDAAGVVHGQEYVFDATATKRIGVANLEALRAGRSIAANSVPSDQGGSIVSDGGGQGNVTVNQSISVAGRVDRRTSSQIARDSARQQRVAQARLG